MTTGRTTRLGDSSSIFGLLVLSLALLPFFLGGCAIGERVNSTNEKTTGAKNDASFKFVSAQFAEAALEFEALEWHDLIVEDLHEHSKAGDHHAGGSRFIPSYAASHSLISVDFSEDSTSKWITATALLLVHEDTLALVDSMQFFSADSTPFLPDSANPIDSMSWVDIRFHGVLPANDHEHFVGTVTTDGAMLLSVAIRDSVGGNTLVFDLTQTSSYSGTVEQVNDQTCTMNATAVLTAKEVFVLAPHEEPVAAKPLAILHGSCPLLGSAHIDLNVECTVSDSSILSDQLWSIDALFIGGSTTTVTIENRTHRWKLEQACDPE